MSDLLACPACKHVAAAVFGLWDSGQLGPQCARCQNPLGPASTPPMPAAMVRDDKYNPVAAPVPYKSQSGGTAQERSERPQPESPRASARPSVSRAPRPAPVPRQTSATDDLEILRERLAEVAEEEARIRIEVCRLRGLETEEKHLRREIARLEDRRMADRARGREIAEPTLVNGSSTTTPN